MAAKTTMSDPGDQIVVMTDCTMPTRRPPRMAPGRLPRPPTTTTTKANGRMTMPILGCKPCTGAIRAPARPARPVPAAKATVNTR